MSHIAPPKIKKNSGIINIFFRFCLSAIESSCLGGFGGSFFASDLLSGTDACTSAIASVCGGIPLFKSSCSIILLILDC
ncbi:MAG TPA: hypothetical protein PKC55_08010 [Dysgonomonas sp.]|uniref:hypothetical protein n=1 Tax=Dysgonomonas sp. TaxID=1891233 RepID=UPI002B880581|nr:hypothetical protein [Dysgonomonas sp.]HML64754.1 hypothetical protein [Dysgonomonas sp.]